MKGELLWPKRVGRDLFHLILPTLKKVDHKAKKAIRNLLTRGKDHQWHQVLARYWIVKEMNGSDN